MGGNLCISVVGEHKLAIKIADLALKISHSNELLNFKTIAHAYEGDIHDAVEAFKKIKLNEADMLTDYIYLATAGLLHFRNRDENIGRDLYKSAEAKAPADTKGLVRLFRAREELAYSAGQPNDFVSSVVSEKYDNDNLWALQIQKLLLDSVRTSASGHHELKTLNTKMPSTIELPALHKIE